jgi:hypothetical protein
MKKASYLLFALLTFLQPVTSNAQYTNGLQYPTLLKELNRDIWVPYSEAILANDATRLIALMAPDFVRVFSFEKKIENRTQFSERMQKAFKKNKKEEEQVNERPVNIIFRYSERVITEAFASERGVYQNMFANAQGEIRSTYEVFHALSRKENGTWKMVSFYASHEKGTIGAREYNNCVPIDIISKF